MGTVSNKEPNLILGIFFAIMMVFPILFALLLKRDETVSTETFINNCKYDTTVYDYYKDKHHRAKGGDWIEYTRVTYDKFNCNSKPIYLKTSATIEESEYRHSTLTVEPNWKIVEANFSRSESILSARIQRTADSILGSTNRDTSKHTLMKKILGKEPRMF